MVPSMKRDLPGSPRTRPSRPSRRRTAGAVPRRCAGMSSRGRSRGGRSRAAEGGTSGARAGVVDEGGDEQCVEDRARLAGEIRARPVGVGEHLDEASTTAAA